MKRRNERTIGTQFSLLIPVKNGCIVLPPDAAVALASPKMAPFFPGTDRIVLSRSVHR
jgi:hypothetical protein